MELFEPSNFFNMAGVMANVFTGLVAVAGLLIALETYRIAKSALGEWRNQKSHDVDDEAVINMNGAISHIREMTNAYADLNALQDYEKVDAAKIKDVDENYYLLFIRHKYYWNRYKKNKEHDHYKSIALKVFRISNDTKIVSFYNDYIFLTTTIFSIVMNYYAELLNQFDDKYQVLNEKEHVDLNLAILTIIPENILEKYKDKSKIEIAYIFFTGEGLDKWVKKLNDTEISYLLQRSNISA